MNQMTRVQVNAISRPGALPIGLNQAKIAAVGSLGDGDGKAGCGLRSASSGICSGVVFKKKGEKKNMEREREY